MKIDLSTIVAAIGALREVAARPYARETWELSTRCWAVAHQLESAIALEKVEIVKAPAETESA